jgi:hypothetical protein
MLMQILILVLWIAAFAGRAAIADIAPQVVKDYTQQDFYRELLAFNREQMVVGYQSGGRKNPAWDAAATHTMDLLALFSTQNSTEQVSALPMYPDARIETPELSAAAQKAIDLGCDDPIVLYARAVCFVDDGLTREARDLLDKADTALKVTTYAPLLRCRLVNRRLRLATDAKARGELWPRVEQLCMEVASQKFSNAASERESARTIIIAMAWADRQDYESALHEFTSTPQFDRWILAELTAEIESRNAQEARGYAWAQDTPPIQMLAFEKLMAKAQTAALTGYQLHPEFPESATMMINAERGNGNVEEAKSWFQKSLAAQHDYATAYSAIYMALQPRWGGSTGQCMAIAKEAADSNRFDTSIPFEYVLGVYNIASDAYGGDKNAFKDPQVKQTTTDILTKYLAQEKNPVRIDYLKSCLVALDVASKDMAPARQLLDQIQGNPSPNAFRLFNEYAPREVEQIYMATISDPKGVADFHRAVSRHYYKNAGNFLQGIINRDRPPARAAKLLQRLKAGTDVMMQYEGGQPISLIDEASRGFWDSESDYRIAPDGITIRPEDGFSLVNRFVLTDRHYELHLKFEFDDVKATRDQRVSVGWGLNDGYVGWSVNVTGDPAQVMAQAPDTDNLDKDITTAMPILAKNTIDILYFDDVPTVKVNGISVPMDFGNQAVYGKFKPINRISLSSSASVHLTEMTLHHLAAKP